MENQNLNKIAEIQHTKTILYHSQKYNSWLEIDLSAIAHNITQYKKIVAPALLAPVIKSNAYGHGIELVGKFFDQNELVDIICVVSVPEALQLRSIGIKKQILVLSILCGDLQQAIEQNIQLVVCDISFAVLLNEIAKKSNKKAEIHIKIDTGLNRLGLQAHTALKIIKEINSLAYITIKGIFTHFAESESEDQTFTNLQISIFENLLEQLENEHISISLRHASCSAAITANAKAHFNMTRVGVGIYGMWPSAENKLITQQQYPQFTLKPALTWKTTIIQIKEVPANSYIGYDCTYKTSKKSIIATLPIGYWDGYDRAFSNTGKALINNKLCPVVGRIAMNLAMVDVSEVDAHIGSEVILLGSYSGVTAEDLAARCNTINYEIVTRINPLLPRMLI